VNILFLARWVDATSYFRCELPAKYISSYGHECRMDYIKPLSQVKGSGLKEHDIQWADVIIFQRPIATDEVEIIADVKSRYPGKLLVGEYDDNYDDVPIWNPGYTYIGAKRGQWSEALKYYDMVTVSTEPLKELIVDKHKYKGPVKVIKNSMDLNLFESSEPNYTHKIVGPDLSEEFKDIVNFEMTVEQFNKITEDKIVVGWFGSRTHYGDIDLIENELLDVLKDNEDVVLLFVGFLNWRTVLSVDYGRLFYNPGVWPVQKYLSFLKAVNIDVSLSPVAPNAFNRCKSFLKVLEAMAAGFIPVASEFDTYEHDMFEGFYADYTYGSWRTQINKAIDEVRFGNKKKFADKNYEIVQEFYDAKNMVREWISFFEEGLSKK